MINRFGQHYRRRPIRLALRLAVYERDNFTCQYCGCHVDAAELQIDHIIPVSRGGTNDIDNLITSCATCNKKKGARWEQGRQSPDAKKLALLADALSTSVAYLSGETNGSVLQEKIHDGEDAKDRLIINNNDLHINMPDRPESFKVIQRFFDWQLAKQQKNVAAPAM